MIKKIALISLFLFQINIIFGNDNQSLKIKINGEQPTGFNRFFQTVMPNSSFTLEVLATNFDNVVVKSSFGKLVFKSNRKWKYIAPDISGSYEVIISDTVENQTITLTVFVLTPLSDKNGEYLNGYRIGNYPEGSYKGKNNYSKPVGLIEVTKENKNTYITPHFQLKQFLCKQSSGWPKYLLINPKLLIKLEYLLAELNVLGVDVSTLFIMSGYRTPYYNKSIGNVKFSRHVFGDAADIYVDKNLDGVMDDLDGNGKSEMADGMIVYSIINKMDTNSENKYLIGGMGKYNKNSAHTYFIHIDTRGYKARW